MKINDKFSLATVLLRCYYLRAAIIILQKQRNKKTVTLIPGIF